METTTQQKMPLQAFLEDTLGLGAQVQHKNVVSILEGTGSKFYSGYDGHLTATIDAISHAQWHHIHHQEEGVALVDVLIDAKGRIQEFARRELAKVGQVMDEQRLPKMVAGNLDLFIGKLREMHFRRRCGNLDMHHLRTSFTLRPVNDGGKNWDVVLRAMVIEPNEKMYIEYVLPKIIHAREHLIVDVQVQKAIEEAQEFIEMFQPDSDAFLPFMAVRPAELIAHYLVHDGLVTAEKIYEVYHSHVNLNVAIYNTPALKAAAAKVLPWEILEVVQKKIWTGAVEVARLYVSMSMQWNRHRALNGASSF